MEADFHLGRTGAAAEDGGPVEEAWLRSAEAEHAARQRRRADPAAHEAAAQAWEAVERPYPAALMRWRAGRGARRRRRPRGGDAAALERAHAIAARLGAGWLRGEIEGLAARARLASPRRRRAPPRPRRPSRQEDPFGLTPRERQVLVARGRGRARTARSASRCSWPRRRRASTCRGSSPSSTCAAAPRRRRSPTASASTATSAARDRPDAAFVGSPPVERIGFVGLGIMGSRMAANLRRAGYELTVYNRTRETAEALGRRARRHRRGDARRGRRRQPTSSSRWSSTAPQVQEVLLGEHGVAEGAAEGTLCVDMSTIAPGDSRAHRRRAGAARDPLRRRAGDGLEPARPRTGR